MNNTIKVALVDDAQLMRDGMADLFREYPQFEIYLASNGRELINFLASCIPDVVLLDMEMPEMDGFETTIYLRKYYPDVRIIILTLHDDKELAYYLLRHGVRGYMDKDSDICEVVKAIETVLEPRGYYFNEYVDSETLENAVINAILPNATYTQREDEIVPLLRRGYTNKEVGELLHISQKTVEAYRTSIIEKGDRKSMAGVIVDYFLMKDWRIYTRRGYRDLKLKR